MKKFLEFFTEAEKLKHLTHVEDRALQGKRGFRQAFGVLHGLHKSMTGKKQAPQMSAKYDGAPSLVFGHHPESGEFFVATKSAWNKNPKINRSHTEIRDNYPDKPGLRAKLHMALATLPKVSPGHGVYQGDVMYTRPDIKRHGERLSVQPNTINYQTDSSTPHGQKMKSARIGMVVHTAYDGKSLSDLKSRPITDLSHFGNHEHVHLISPEVNNKSDYSGKRQSRVRMALGKAYEHAKGVDYGALRGHDAHVQMYVNQAVRDNARPSAKGYHSFLLNRATTKGDVKEKQFSDLKTNHQHFDKVFKAHQYLQLAKNTIVSALDPHNTHFHTSIQGKPVGHEGYVVGGQDKLVKRHKFSFANFMGAGKFQKEEVLNEIVKDRKNVVPTVKGRPKDTLVMTFGRMNPVTWGHEKVVDKVKKLADKMAGDHVVIATGSHGDERNPLTPNQKLKHLKRAFPQTKIKIADPADPTIMSHVKNASAKGYKNLVMVVGDDQKKKFGDMLKKYNGKEYHFHKIKLVSSGERGGEGNISATDMRNHVRNNNYYRFKQGLPKHLHDNDTLGRELFNDLKGQFARQAKSAEAKKKAKTKKKK